ncbi:MAG: Gfo/Idh/MocA family oxidoreductase [Treponema sp.]|jgi:predicted dehydrogenase|nr:Gfo/Idh/MocA family oxidoreductase [Treponema sp.]
MALPIGIVGAGAISGIYLDNLTGMFAGRAEVAGISDQVTEKARAAAQKYGIRAFDSVDAMLRDERVAIILNLTTPPAHYDVARRALEAGKHVYNEKPLCTTREDAAALLALARERGLRVGCAPDTFMGAGLQTCRALIDAGRIGRPVAATAFMLCHGHESWHPSPAFYYQRGGGPMFDMGPYYLSALVSLLGPASRVCGSAQKSFPTRTITSEPLRGQVVQVEVPTHIAGVIDFASGAVGTIITSFDVWHHHLPWITIYGTEGTLEAPDPNTFRGTVRVRRHDEEAWEESPLILSTGDNCRGAGITDMAEAIAEGRPHRASGELGFHVLDMMQGFHEASASGRCCTLASPCGRPAPMEVPQ